MESGTIKRRIAAIVSTDVVGYSRLMERSEDRTLDAIRELHARHIGPSVLRHGGRIFKLLGDGTLVVFDAVAEAVRCAIALQTEVKATQDTVRDTDRLVIRIGINLSDVIIEGDDVLATASTSPLGFRQSLGPAVSA
jgi:class 3 adenylate cyclase